VEPCGVTWDPEVAFGLPCHGLDIIASWPALGAAVVSDDGDGVQIDLVTKVLVHQRYYKRRCKQRLAAFESAVFARELDDGAVVDAMAWFWGVGKGVKLVVLVHVRTPDIGKARDVGQGDHLRQHDKPALCKLKKR
jgi:hypothetical protein